MIIQVMIFEGEHSVIQAIKEKKRLMEAGEEHGHIRVLCIQGGGIVRSVYGAGGMLALEELGYTKVFTSLVGISSGAIVVGYFAAGEIYKGVAVFVKDILDKRFVNIWRFWNQVNTQHFINMFRSHNERKINIPKVLGNSTEVYFGATKYETADPVLLKPNDEDSFLQSLHASINMPNVSPIKVMVDGQRYTDGGFSNPHIFALAVEQLKPTHVLIVTNNDQDFKSVSKLERFLNRTLYRFRLNGLLARAINTRREARDEALEKISSSGVPVAVVWGDGSIGAFESNVEKIEATIEASRIWWHGLFSGE